MNSQATVTQGTKESSDLKDYAEKMVREQKLSSQKLNQLVSRDCGYSLQAISLQQMTRTIGFFFQNLEKRQILIKSLTTLKTENSRLKETITVRTQQVEEMTSQLQAVATAKQDLYNLLTKLLARLEQVKSVQSEIHSLLVNQEGQASHMDTVLSSLRERIQENEKLYQESGRQKRGLMFIEQEELKQKESELREQTERSDTLTKEISEMEQKIDLITAEQKEKEEKLKEQKAVIDRLTEEASALRRIDALVGCRIDSGKENERSEREEKSARNDSKGNRS